MLRRILITQILTSIILIICLHAQNLSQAEKEQIISNLDSASFFLRYDAVHKIDRFNIVEALPKLEENIWKEDCDLRDNYLRLIDKFNSPNTYNIALAFIDSADYIEDCTNFESPLSLKVQAVQILFKFNDYSKVNYVFDLLRNELNSGVNVLLPEILMNVPTYEDSVRYYWFKIVSDTSLSGFDRYFALYNINRFYGSEAIPHAINLFTNNNDELGGSRILAFEILCNLNYEELNTLIRERISLEPASSYRVQIIDTLLKRYGTPNDYKFVKDFREIETNETARILIGSAMRNFIPPRPVTSTSVSDMVSNLSSTTDTLFNYNWLGDLAFANSLKTKLNQAKTYLLAADSLSCAVQVKSFQDDINLVYKDSLNPDPRFVTIEGWKFLYWNAQYILDRLPEPTANPNLVVNLKNSQGTQIPASSVKYYDASWKDAVDNGDGTFTVITERQTVSLRMFYEYANQTVNNVPAQNNTYTFQTVAANVQLKNSLGNSIDEGQVKYYAGAWRDFGTTTNGVATKELLPINYSFRMTYEYASIDKQQDLATDPTVVFQSVNAAVQLKNSSGNLIDQGTVKYYAGAWRDFGTTTNGVATKELLPINYSFRMSYEYASLDKQQNLSVDPIVVFQTVNAQVQLQNSLGNLIDAGTVQYYAGAWRSFGTTTNGVAAKELLPINYSFRMTHEFLSNDKQQNLSTNPVVDFQTVLCTVKVTNSTNQPISNSTVRYYGGAWRDLGTTNTEGLAVKELLPRNISFRASYGSTSQDKQLDIGTNNLVEILLNIP